MDDKAVSTTLPGGTKVTCSPEQAKRYAAEARPASKAPAKKAASSKPQQD